MKTPVSFTYIHGPKFLSYISNTVYWIYIILGIAGQFDITNDLILFIGHYDLYFMVQGFSLEA